MSTSAISISPISSVPTTKSKRTSGIPVRATSTGTSNGSGTKSTPSTSSSSSSGRSDQLSEEAARMEVRLAQLKKAMSHEAEQRAAIKKTKVGTFWKGANPTQGEKKYMEEVMERAERRIAKSKSGENTMRRMSNTNSVEIQSTQQQQPSGNSVTSTRTPSADTFRAIITTSTPKSTVPSSSSSIRSTSSTSTTTNSLDSKSSYAPPIQPMSTISQPSQPRLQGSASSIKVTSGTNTDNSSSGSKTVGNVIVSRVGSAARTSAGTQSNSSSTTLRPTSSSSPSTTFINPADDDTYSGAPGSLLEGTYDESENKQWFQQARDEWMGVGGEERKTTEPTTRSITKSSITLIHDPDYTPTSLATNSSTLSNSLLDGPEFNERESAKDFAEARKAWLESSGGNVATSKSKPSASSHTNSSVIVPSSSHPSRPSTSSTRVSSQLSEGEKSSKTSCYHCYKLFYYQPNSPDENAAAAAAAESASDSANINTKLYCTPACKQASESQQRVKCSAVGCPKLIKKSDGKKLPTKSEELYCTSCAENKGKFVKENVLAVLPTSSAQVPSTIDEPEEAENGEEEEEVAADEEEEEAEADAADLAESGIPSAASPEHQSFHKRSNGSRLSSKSESATSSTEVSRPTSSDAAVLAPSVLPVAASSSSTSTAPILDTSVIHTAPAVASVETAVIEFPDDDDE